MLPAMREDHARLRHRVLLVGPRVVALHEMFERRGYATATASTGVDGMSALTGARFDLVVLELDLVDLTATELMMAARQGAPRTAFVLVDEPARATHVVKAWQAGMDGFIAAPAEEDRLFSEIERHVTRTVPRSPDDVSGFEDDSPQTQMTTIEGSRGGDPDVRAQLELAQEGLASLAAENSRMTAELRRLAAVESVLAQQLEGPLDANEAKRLRERLATARAAELEAQSLRSEAQRLRAAADERDEHLATMSGELRAARAAVNGQGDFETRTDGGDRGVLEQRLADLEQELNRRQRRAVELEATVAAAKIALASADQKTEAAIVEARGAANAERDAAVAKAAALDEQLGLLQAELDRLGGVMSRSEAAAAQAKLAAERARDDLAEQHAQAIRDAIAAERARVERERGLALEQATIAATRAAEEKHRVALDRAIAVERERLATREQAAVLEAKALARSEVEADVNGRAEQRIATAVEEARVQRERAQDIELQLEEARTRIEFLELDASRVEKEADERVAAAELSFKREKLRLVEEKQAAASGSQEAVLRMDALREETLAARRLAEEADARVEAMRTEVVAATRHVEEANARTGAAEAAVVDVMIARDAALDEARVQQDARERETVRAEALLESTRRLEDTIVGLQAQLREVEKREEAALAVAAAAAAAAATAEADSERRLAAAVLSTRAEHEAQMKIVDDELADAKAAAAMAIARAEACARELADANGERSALALRVTTQAQEAEARSQQERARAEQESAAAAASLATMAAAHNATAQLEREANDLRGQLAAATDRITAQQVALDAAAIHEADVTRMAGELDELRRRLVGSEGHAPSSSMATVRAVVDAVEPMRWGLGSAIDYFSPFEANDPVLAGHIRHLRLLSAALSRLVLETGGPPKSG